MPPSPHDDGRGFMCPCPCPCPFPPLAIPLHLFQHRVEVISSSAAVQEPATAREGGRMAKVRHATGGSLQPRQKPVGHGTLKLVGHGSLKPVGHGTLRPLATAYT